MVPAALLVPDGAEGGLRAPRAGEVFRNQALAASFDELARSHDAGEGAAGFYSGRVGRAIAEAVRAAGGVLALDDLFAHRSSFPEPLSADFCGLRVHEVPPNGQGIVALAALQIVEAVLKGTPPPPPGTADPLAALNDGAAAATTSLSWTGGLDLASALPGLEDADRAALARLAALGHSSAAHLHLVAEALRLAFADARAHVGDADVPGSAVAATAAAMLAPGYAARRAATFDPRRAAADVSAGAPLARSDTVSFSVVDGAGLAVSFINSNYMGFGTGLCPTGVGFSLQNRGAGFSLVEGHPNCVAPGKRPYHTIIPLMITARDGSFVAAASNMGGFMQPQGHAQLVLNLLAFGAQVHEFIPPNRRHLALVLTSSNATSLIQPYAVLSDPQTAVDAPRLCIADGTAGGAIALEDGVRAETADALAAAGHLLGPSARGLVTGFGRALFGRAQVVLRDPRSGVLWGGSDGRGDGLALACRCEGDSARAAL